MKCSVPDSSTEIQCASRENADKCATLKEVDSPTGRCCRMTQASRHCAAGQCIVVETPELDRLVELPADWVVVVHRQIGYYDDFLQKALEERSHLVGQWESHHDQSRRLRQNLDWQDHRSHLRNHLVVSDHRDESWSRWTVDL